MIKPNHRLLINFSRYKNVEVEDPNTKRFKRTLIYFNTDIQYANIRGNPFCQEEVEAKMSTYHLSLSLVCFDLWKRKDLIFALSLPPSLCLCLSLCLSLSLNSFLSLCLCLDLCLSVSVCLCLSACLSVCLSEKQKTQERIERELSLLTPSAMYVCIRT